ncbi:hypothetical protein [Nocardiopsis sp. NPDC058789]|uniref:hypothetical protein n=1 Tax=Nocardiopsis sp. NPDC058789 TaxID=3346634 RepID=UPI00366D4146
MPSEKTLIVCVSGALVVTLALLVLVLVRPLEGGDVQEDEEASSSGRARLPASQVNPYPAPSDPEPAVEPTYMQSLCEGRDFLEYDDCKEW